MTNKIFEESELILREDGSIYHLGLLPEDIANTIIFVGDQNRVEKVSKYFDTIEIKKQIREFKTHTGVLNKKRISVISTGIGCDNIDIVLNELDALVNIDFKTRQIKKKLTSLNILRIGTSGTLQKDIPVDSFLLSTHGLGIDGMLNYYSSTNSDDSATLLSEISKQTKWPVDLPPLYLYEANKAINNTLKSSKTIEGITVTANGFYAPQGRELRLETKIKNLNDRLNQFSHPQHRITNLEMETSGILGLGCLLGHNCGSISAILANRFTKSFSKNPDQTIDDLIQYCLSKLTA